MPDVQNLLVIICDTSGAQKDVKPGIEKLLKKSKISFAIKKVTKPPEITDIIKKQADKFKAIAVYGGDGSITTAIKALTGSKTKLLVLPGGTGNVIATSLGVPMDETSLLKLYLTGTYSIANYDVAEVNGKKLALDMYVGWWAKATLETPREHKKKWGQIAYGLSAVKSFSGNSLQKYELSIDGRAVRTKAYTAIIANREAQVFLGLKLFPHKHRPGVMRIAMVKSISPIRVIIWIVGRSLGSYNIGGLIKIYSGNEIVIKKSPSELLYDDQESKVKIPTKITGGLHETLLVVPSEPPDTSLTTKVLLWAKLTSHILKERVRNFFSGQPSYATSHFAPHIYVGGAYRAKAYDQFKRWGVTGIINMRSSVPAAAPKGFKILHLKTSDWGAPNLENLTSGVEFAQEQIDKGGSVYIHCRQGEGRGPTMAAAYLVSQGLSVEEAVAHIKKFRPMAHPNKTQIRQLVQWQERQEVTKP